MSWSANWNGNWVANWLANANYTPIITFSGGLGSVDDVSTGLVPLRRLGTLSTNYGVRAF